MATLRDDGSAKPKEHTMHDFVILALLGCFACCGGTKTQAATPDAGSQARFASHAPMRPLPEPSSRALAGGPAQFVDATLGNDENPGTEASPWKTLRHALRRVEPGVTLYLRSGTYFEKVHLTRSGMPEAPITIRAYPGELAIVDGGLREFVESPESAWRPFASGVAGEFVSARTYLEHDVRRTPNQFLPAAWEPMWGIENERPVALGHFADSMVPLHSYRVAVDLRSQNELWRGKGEMRDSGIYCGPGLWFDRATGRVHVRLAPHRLAGLGDRSYRGATDPRRLPLAIAVGFGDDVLRINGIQHVRIQDVVFRGATGSPLIHVYGSQHIELDHVTAFGGFPALLINASQHIRVVHSAFRGLAAPWSSRAHMKYRGTASYQIVFQNDQPVNQDIEFAWCEFTDDHDFAFLRYAKDLRFHHNFVDNFNDDGLECGPKRRDHTLFIYQNRIGRCLIPLAQHEIEKDESPHEHDPASGVYLYRNVFDLRGGTYRAPPAEPPAGPADLAEEGHLAGDHGSPVWPVMRFYHNTALRVTPVLRDYFLFGLGAQGMRHSERDVFNNVFVQMDRVPGVGFAGITNAELVREGGNVLWGVVQGPELRGDFFARFRASPLFAASRKHYEPGWTTHDRVADPRFVRLGAEAGADLRLQSDSGAIDFGLPVPREWPDPLRDVDAGRPDAGALPLGARSWTVGVDGRISLGG